MESPSCPECVNGKHQNCDQVAMTEDGEIVACLCREIYHRLNERG